MSVSNRVVRSFASRASAALCAVLFVTLSVGAGDRPHSRYPNELQGFRFYAKYLAPLRPGMSDRDAVRRVLGTEPVKRDGWTITPFSTLGTLYQITIRPDGVIPMSTVKFSPSFDHCHISVSEINISFDVYSDRFGLEYWLHEEDSEWGKKGDLYLVAYGASRQRLPPNTIC
jgi:hypothetical protein